MNYKEIAKTASNLLIVCLCVGALLALANQITREPIKAQELKATLESRQKLLPADEYVDLFTDEKGKLDDDLITGLKEKKVLSVVKAVKNGNFCGFVIETGKTGYSSFIKTMYSVNPKYQIAGILVKEQAETPGLGDKITKEPFIGRFKNKSVSSLILTKTEDENIKAITGATISSRAMTESVHDSLEALIGAIKEQAARKAGTSTQQGETTETPSPVQENTPAAAAETAPATSTETPAPAISPEKAAPAETPAVNETPVKPQEVKKPAVKPEPVKHTTGKKPGKSPVKKPGKKPGKSSGKAPAGKPHGLKAKPVSHAQEPRKMVAPKSDGKPSVNTLIIRPEEGNVKQHDAPAPVQINFNMFHSDVYAAGVQIDPRLKELLPAYGYEQVVSGGFRGLDKYGKTTGYVVKTVGKGYAGDIIVGYSADTSFRLITVRILQQNETPGYGDKTEKSDFLGQFKGKSSEKIVVRKNAPQSDDYICAISHATISSTAVINCVRGSLERLRTAVKQEEGK
ncbi:MAG: RnfABCDGE type electron transport complex subunit G [Firmicutes bacterium]|nr:RnfABCDGE type electron transport complex subunit G [Bacillota bacterium]